MTEPIPVAAYGLGPIGLRIADRLLCRPSTAELVAAVDIDEEKIGQDLGVLLERDPIGLVVTGTLAEAGAFRRLHPGVCVLANLVPDVAQARPGLLTMADPVPSGSATRPPDWAVELDDKEPVTATSP